MKFFNKIFNYFSKLNQIQQTEIFQQIFLSFISNKYNNELVTLIPFKYKRIPANFTRDVLITSIRKTERGGEKMRVGEEKKRRGGERRGGGGGGR